jgi:hypothetical protein
MGVNIESMFLVLATDNELEIFFLVFLEIIFHLQLDQSFNFFKSSILRFGLSTYLLS